MPGYGPDLAAIHDAGFGGFSLSAAPALLEILRERGLHRGLVVDLGCGSGHWAAELTQAGYDVLGVDASAAMIAIARRRAPAARFVRSSFLDVMLPACVAVTALGECLGYLLDERNRRKGLAALFSRVHAALRPGGVFAFDLLEPGCVPRGGPVERFREGRDWAVLVRLEESRRERILTRRIVSFRRVGGSYRRREEVHRVALYERGWILDRLRRAGMRARAVDGYGELRFDPRHAGYIAWKPRRAAGVSRRGASGRRRSA